MAPQMMALGVAWITWSSHNGYGGIDTEYDLLLIRTILEGYFYK